MRIVKQVGLVVVAVALVFSVGGCAFFGPKGFVEGTVVDATDPATPVAGIEVSAEGLFGSVTTDAAGKFMVEAPAGTATLTFSANGWVARDTDVAVEADATTTLSQPILASQKFLDDGVRFVLTWGQSPADLDLHIWTPGGTTHVYHDNKNQGNNPSLDIDDLSSFGPETITLLTPVTGDYEVYVHNWSGRAANSTPTGATVSVYFSDNTIRTYDVPSTGSGDWWHVGTLNGSTFTPKTTLGTSAPYGFSY
jgi:hypothetical protein